MAHPHCKQFIGNDCGLPSVCAKLCAQDAGMREMSASMSDVKMNGWVKLWNVSSSSGVGKWRNSWALIESNKLSFFDTDSLAANNGTPFLSVNLDTVLRFLKFHIPHLYCIFFRNNGASIIKRQTSQWWKAFPMNMYRCLLRSNFPSTFFGGTRL
jgi:hypothetical protein